MIQICVLFCVFFLGKMVDSLENVARTTLSLCFCSEAECCFIILKTYLKK